jgi:copper chaperone NosL
MTIVEIPFGCELVSAKGKVLKFDAIECLVGHYNEYGKDSSNSVYVTDYANPGTLIDGKTAVYLQCPDIPSPMGAFLSAHLNSGSAEKAKGNSEGRIFTWEQLLKNEL